MPAFRKHRHLVAVPLTLALLMGVLASNPGDRQPASAQRFDGLLSAAHPLADVRADVTFAAEPSVHGTLSAGGTLEGDGRSAVLRAGAVLVRTSGVFSLEAGSAAVHGVRTAWYALQEDAGTTVVALAAPIAVVVRGETLVLSAGDQLRVSADAEKAPQRSTVPLGWLQEQMGRLAALPPDAVNLQTFIPDSSPLRALRDAVQVRDYSRALAFAKDPGNEPALHADAHRLAVAAVLADLAGRGHVDADGLSLALRCATILSADVPFDRYLSVSYGIGRLSADDRGDEVLADAFVVGDDAARWAALLSDVAHATSLPVPDAFADRWRKLVERTAATDAAAASVLIAQAADLSVEWEDRGYPLHARSWDDAVRTAAQFARPLLGDGDRVVMDQALLSAAAKALPAKPAEKPSSSSSSAPVATLPPDELVARARQAVLARGGMLSTATSFVAPPSEPDAVRVLGAVFPTKAGDASFDFTYRPLQDTLDRIVLEGRLFPNTLTFDQFLSGL